MGGGNSQTIDQTFEMNVLNESLFKQVTTNQQSLSSSLGNEQEIYVEVNDMGEKCDIDLTQTINSSSVSSAVMEPQTIASTKTAAETHLQTVAQAAAEKSTQAGNFQFGDSQNLSQDVQQNITNIVEQVFETENINSVVAEMVNVQEGVLKIGKCNGKISLDQNITASLAAEAITKSVSEAVAENEVLSDLAASAGATTKSEAGGLAELVDSIGGALTGPMKYAAMASVACVCIICLVLLMFMLSPSGQKSANRFVNAGMRRFNR